MSSHQFTEEQKRASEVRNKNILVYASAGSGKTTVLVQRVINGVLSGISLSNMLIVTFTNAAASEMKQRIRSALTDKLSEKNLSIEQTYFLKNELKKLPLADIETLDSFCQKVIRQYFNVVDIDPGYRIMTDPNEVNELKNSAFESVFGTFLAKYGSQFFDLVRNFANGKNIDIFQSLVLKIESYSSALPNQKLWIDSLDQLYEFSGSFSNSNFFNEQLKPTTIEDIQNIFASFIKIKEMTSEVPAFEAYNMEANICLDFFNDSFENLADFDYQQLRDYLNEIPIVSPRSKRIKSEDPLVEIREEVKELRDSLKKKLGQLIELFIYDEDEISRLSTLTAKRIKLLSEFTKVYLDQVDLLKRQANIFEFSDLEIFTYLILSKSVVAREHYQKQFKEILIDEYQDINDLQDSILGLLSGDQHNLFMVGDAKQSIYGFRHANPQLFLQKYRDYQQSSTDDNEVIVLAKNYRSVANIDETVNFFFEQLMDQKVGELDYDENSHLKFGLTYPQGDDNSVEFLIDSAEDNYSKEIHQVHLVISKIKELLGKPLIINSNNDRRPIKLSDIAILTRTKSANRVILNEFKKADLNIVVSEKEDFFVTTEIKLIISLLKLIDNHDQDIPLVAILKSPFVGLDDNQLAIIRSNVPNESFWQAIKNYHETNQDLITDRLTKLFELLENIQKINQTNDLSKTLNYIYYDSHFLDYITLMVGGDYRRENLQTFINRAKEFQNNSVTNLSEFVRYLSNSEKILDRSKIANISNEDIDAVRLMTIHAAKGLEFPVVFLFQTNKLFNYSDLRGNYILNEDLGIGFRFIDENKISYDLPQITFIKQKENTKLISEELRVLYVAMTRPEKKLFIVGSDNKFLENIEKSSKRAELLVSVDDRLKSRSFLQLFDKAIRGHELLMLPNKCEFQVLINNNLTDNKADLKLIDNPEIKFLDKNNKEKIDLKELVIDPDLKLVDHIDKTLNWQYPYLGSLDHSAYQSVSDLKTLFDEPDDENIASIDSEKLALSYKKTGFDLPKFKQKTQVSSAGIGSATHLVLREISLEKTPRVEDFQMVINNLVEKKLFSFEVGNAIDVDHLVNFFKSDLGQLIIHNNSFFKREFSFQAVVKANYLYPNENFYKDDAILIHGIIDGFIKFDDQIVLLDYKTDKKINDNKSFKDLLIERYRGQLKIYQKVLSEMYDTNKIKSYLIALSDDDVIDLS